jgi:hypothetical protein
MDEGSELFMFKKYPVPMDSEESACLSVCYFGRAGWTQITNVAPLVLFFPFFIHSLILFFILFLFLLFFVDHFMCYVLPNAAHSFTGGIKVIKLTCTFAFRKIYVTRVRRTWWSVLVLAACSIQFMRITCNTRSNIKSVQVSDNLNASVARHIAQLLT